MCRTGIALLLLFHVTVGALAQKARKQRVARERSPQQELVYDDVNYLPVIRTVRFAPQDTEYGLPLLTLHSDEQLTLTFDDLRGDVRNYYFSIEHCGADWQPSRLSPLEYAEGFNEDRIRDYVNSSGTRQPYTQYRVHFPTDYVRPKLAGNYLLKVYEDADKRRLVLTRRFYVLAPLMTVMPEVVPSVDVTRRRANQKLNLEVNTGGLTINNPYQDVKVLVMQNLRPDVQQWLNRPHFVSNNRLTYNDVRTLDFGGGNEFRYIDLRSLRLASERVAAIRQDSLVRVELLPDENYRDATYASVFDENGAFYIRNQDRPEAETESDYAWVTFTLADPTTNVGTVYVVGGFNRFARNDNNRMTYDPARGQWQCTIPLKQGLYDYEYVHVDGSGTVDPSFSSGDHFETNNTYQVLVYVRRPGTTWEELVGYAAVDTESLR